MSGFGRGLHPQGPEIRIGKERKLPNLIGGFLDYTKNAPSPFRYRKWGILSAIGACMTRRAFTWTEQGIIYPNSATLLVGNASTGKGPTIDPIERLLRMIDTTHDVVHQYEGIHVGPGDTTVAGLFDEFIDEGSQKTYVDDKGNTHHFSSVIMIAEELSAFMHHVDLQMMGYLIKFLNCQSHSQRLRSKGETMTIERPVLHILGGVQPKMLTQIFPVQAFGMGLTARTTFVYSDETVKVSPFTKNKLDKDLETNLLHDLTKVTRLVGTFTIHEEAKDKIESWWLTEADKDAQQHPKLEGYNGKRILHLIRLCMIHSAARADHMMIELEDVTNSLVDLLEVESVMPRIFEEMTAENAQTDVYADIAHQLYAEYDRTKKAIPYHILSRMVSRKVKSYEIVTVIEQMLAQQLIKEVKTTAINLPGSGHKAYLPGNIATNVTKLKEVK